MTLFARIFRLVWGGDVDRALRPVLAVGLTGSIAGSALFPFLGIWAIKELHASQSALATAFLVGALLSGGIGYLGGHVSDHIGRRPLILIGWGFQALVPLGLLLVGNNKLAGLTLLALLPAFGALGGAADQAMVADLVAPERQEAAYASVRVAQNLGVTIGPPLGGLFLIGGNWNHLFLGVFPLGLLAASIAYRYIPRGGAYAPEGPPQRGSFAVIIRDNPFLLFMLSSVFATMTYVATETLLPISATTTHNLAPAAWGVLMVVNPLLVTVFQLQADALDGAHPVLREARRRDADDGRAVPAPERERQRSRDRARDLHLRDRRDAVGADVAGRRRRARAAGHPRRLHGRVRQHVVGGLGADAVPRATGARQLRRRDDVDVRRVRRRAGRDHRASSLREAATPSPL